MLSAWYETSRPKPTYGAPIIIGSPTNNSWDDKRFKDVADNLKISVEEVKRRNKIIKEAWTACRLYKGMNVLVANAKEREKTNYKDAVIQGVAADIFEYGTVAWEDHPFIVSTRTDKGVVHCTINYFMPKDGETLASSC